MIRVAVLLPVAVLLAVGCEGPTKRIASSTVAARAGVAQVEQRAAETTNELDAATATGDVGPLAAPHIGRARVLQGEILVITAAASEQLDAILRSIPDVTDRETRFDRLLTFATNNAWIAGVVVVSIAGWYFGAGYVVRPVMRAFGLGIDAAIRAKAAADYRRVQHEGDAMAASERAEIERLRLRNPDYAAAYRLAEGRA